MDINIKGNPGTGNTFQGGTYRHCAKLQPQRHHRHQL